METNVSTYYQHSLGVLASLFFISLMGFAGTFHMLDKFLAEFLKLFTSEYCGRISSYSLGTSVPSYISPGIFFYFLRHLAHVTFLPLAIRCNALLM